MTSHLAFPRQRGKSRAELLLDPVVTWLDPGVTTGWSVMKVHPDALTDPTISILENVTHWSHGQIVGEAPDLDATEQAHKSVAKLAGNGWAIDTSPESHAVHEIVDLVSKWPGTCVGMEDFIVRQFNQDRDFLAPVRMMAAVDYALWRMGIQTFRQQPSEAKGAVTDARLRSWGFYRREGGENHARDADRHVITFLRKMKDPNKGAYRRHLAWPHIYDKKGKRI